MSALAVLLALILLMLSGVPIAFALAGLGAVLLAIQDVTLIAVAQGLHAAIDSFILIAVPLFILMSNILLKGGAGGDLFRAVQAWVGHWPGGLAVATVASCAVFAAMSGSSVATAATVGVVAIPEMIARGYRPQFVYGLLAAGGTLGILIPPSIPMIVLGVVIEESITDLFLAGIGPGVMLASLFAVFAIGAAWRDSRFERIPRASWTERRRASARAFPTVCLAAAILSGIYLGIFTPTEAAGVGFVLSLILTLVVLRSITWRDLAAATRQSASTTVTLLLILAGAKIFAHAITLMRIPHEVSTMMASGISSPVVFVVIVCAILLLMGFFLEALAMIVIMAPVLYPALGALGIDPIWFAIVFVIMIECALITPPVGLNLFVIQSIAKTELSKVIRGAWPFIVIMLLCVAALGAMPMIALYIPLRL